MALHTTDSQRVAYLDLLKRSITNFIYLGGSADFEEFHCQNLYEMDQGRWMIDPVSRPATLLTKAQLDLIEEAAAVVHEQRVAGDFIEAGIWRGGAIIFMRALIEAYAMAGRKVFAADSFAGIPMNTRAKHDPVDRWPDRWIAPVEEVRQNIARFGLLDERVRFVEGFFSDSLPQLQQERFALIRLDSDSYDSVETSLNYLYPLLSRSGIIIIDDWHLPGCRMAVEDYRSRNQIRDPIHERGGNAFWFKHQEYLMPSRP